MIQDAGTHELCWHCLQEELPAQDKMKVGGHNGFLPYMAVANGILGSLSGPERAAVSEARQQLAHSGLHAGLSFERDSCCQR